MSDSKRPASELMAEKELEKIELEITELRDNRSKFSKLAKITLPFIAGLIGLIISIASFVISNATSKRQMELEEHVREREAFRSALDLAFGDKVNQSGHVAGIWALSEFWRKPGYEQQLATILSSILSSGDQDGDASRFAAAEVIGTAIEPEDLQSAKDKERVKRIAKLLYGSHATWSVGTVSYQNSSLRNACPIKNNDCADQLEQTKQAIRKNWEFLEDANFSHTDLSWIQLYVADLKGASLYDALVHDANFTCSDLENTDWNQTEEFKSDVQHAPKMTYANVRGAQPDSFRNWAQSEGAMDRSHDDWVKFRKTVPACKDWEQLDRK
jgi:uncharacterized protein YjbI with pentapeptide repeats